MNEDKQSKEGGQGQAQISIVVGASVKMPPQSMAAYSSQNIEELVAGQITKRIQVPIAVTTAVLCAVLSVSAVLVGIIVLVIPFTIGCAFSVYAVYNLRESILEEPEITSYAVIGEPENQSALLPARTQVLSGNVVDAKQENTNEEKQEKRTSER